jgi:hypothetical protein
VFVPLSLLLEADTSRQAHVELGILEPASRFLLSLFGLEYSQQDTTLPEKSTSTYPGRLAVAVCSVKPVSFSPSHIQPVSYRDVLKVLSAHRFIAVIAEEAFITSLRRLLAGVVVFARRFARHRHGRQYGVASRVGGGDWCPLTL